MELVKQMEEDAQNNFISYAFVCLHKPSHFSFYLAITSPSFFIPDLIFASGILNVDYVEWSSSCCEDCLQSSVKTEP